MEGQLFGRYRVREKLATGGMGEVYVATHELMRREAVVKVLLPQMSGNETIVKRFFQEAQATARIEHPGIVEVFDFGYTNDGRAYLIMERLRGVTLQEYLKARERLPIEQAIMLITQLASAVGAAHDCGIVHRDLKPDNIFIVPDPAVSTGERVKVLDFGLAKLAEQNGSLLTMSGTAFGTPAYMAPEQCMNAAGVDGRADLYAIGCILYRCLCGTPPFGTGGVELVAAQLRDPPIPPQLRRPDIPSQLDAIVVKLLQKSPDARIQTCEALIGELNGLSPRAMGESITEVERVVRPPVHVIDESPSHFNSSLSGSVGEVQYPSPARRSGRALWLAVGFVALGLAGAMLVYSTADEPTTSAGERIDNPTSDSQPIDSEALVEQFERYVEHAERAVAEEDWKGALDVLKQASDLAPRDESRKATIARLQDQARGELNNAAVFQKIRVAAAMNRFDEFVGYFRQLPEDSTYWQRARPAYDRITSEWLDEKYNDAAKLLERNQCDQLKELTDEIVHYFAGQKDDVDPLVVACKEQRDQRAKGKRPAIVARRQPKNHADEQLLSILEAESIQDQARDAYKKGYYGVVFKHCEKARQLSPKQLVIAGMCGLAMCKLKDAENAKLYYAMVSKSHRRVIAKTCAREGINLEMSDKDKLD